MSLLLVLLALLSCSGGADRAKLDDIRRQYPLDQPFPESRFVRVDGVRLHIRQWEPDEQKSGPRRGIVFLVHGLSGSTYNWRFLAPDLVADGWSVLAADLPPFGFSGEKQPDSLSFDPLPADSPARAKLLWDLFDTLYPGFEGGVTLIGHSLGGRVASYLALSRPERTRQLVLLAPAVFGTSAIPSLVKDWPFRDLVQAGTPPVLDDLKLVRTVIEIAYGRPVTEEELGGNLAPFLREGAAQACGVWLAASVESAEPPLEKISVPTLILWSQGDRIVPNKGPRLQTLIRGSVYFEVPGTSHCLMDTDEAFLWPRIRSFINLHS